MTDAASIEHQMLLINDPLGFEPTIRRGYRLEWGPLDQNWTDELVA